MGDEPIVKIYQGKLKGIKCKSEFSQKEYYSFLGIPYGMPPTGKLRFKPPVPVRKWEGIWDATQDGNPCLQYSFYKHRIIGSEDCLYLNVHTPEDPKLIISRRPVVVNLHQGAFVCGSGSTDDLGSPEYLIHHDIVYVTFNYRLHAFGFLNLGIKECSGNAGLKDMVLALKWVNQNIAAFGGDPDNVTIFTSSISTCAAHILMITSKLKGLVHKAVMQGLYAFTDPGSYQENAIDIAIQYAELLGCRSKNPRIILQFLINQNQYLLLKAQGEIRAKLILENPGRYSMTPFYSSIEVESEHAILTQDPRNLMNNIEPIPIIYGKCEHEASLMFYPTHFNIVKSNLATVIKKNLWYHKIDDMVSLEIARKIKRFYFNAEKPLEEFNADVEKFYNDMYYAELYPTTINIIAKKQTTRTPSLYLYNFTYDGDLNYQKQTFLPKLLCWTTPLKGAVHADDAFYWMGGFYSEISIKDKRIIDRMGHFFSNFVKTGDPNGESIDFYWKPYTLDEPCYMQFDDVLEMKAGRFHEDRMKFWDNILQCIENAKMNKIND